MDASSAASHACATRRRVSVPCLLVALALLAAAEAVAAPPAASLPTVCEPGGSCPNGTACLLGLCVLTPLPPGPPLFAVGVAPWTVPAGAAADTALASRTAESLRVSLRGTGLFGVVGAPPGSELGGPPATPAGLSRAQWRAAGAFAVVAGRFSPAPSGTGGLVADVFVLETESGRTLRLGPPAEPVPQEALASLVDLISNRLVRLYTGRPGLIGTRIAFTRRTAPGVKEIFRIPAGGGGAEAVTANGSLNLLPAWGPDGALAWTSYVAGNPDLYLDGQKFASYGNLNTGAAFSPDGTLVAASLQADDVNADIYLLDRRSGQIVRRLTTARSIEVSPAFSPDGRRLAFVSDRTGQPQIYVLDLENGAERRLTNSGSYNTNPAWSPTADVVAYNSMLAGGRFSIYTVDVATGAVRRLTSGSGSQEDPAYSPDGRRIVYAQRNGDHMRLMIMAADGSAPEALTEGAVYDGAPAWSWPPVAAKPVP